MQIAMPPPETKQLLRLIGRATRYLEYGSGGSTAAARRSKTIRTIVSVESDGEFLSELLGQLPDGAADLHPIHADIGPTKAWGHPRRPSSHFAKFPTYVTAPWDLCRELSVTPDLVLIDGRFRVAAFLYSVFQAAPGTMIFFDDFMDRPHYHCVSDVVKPAKIVGRSATFKVPRKIDHALAAHHLLLAAVDWR